MEGECPKCGSHHRDMQVHPASIAIRAVVSVPTIEIEEGPDQPWFSKWFDVREGLRLIEDSYGKSLGNVEMKRRIKAFFGSCTDMRDWLIADDTRLPNIGKRAVEQYFWSSTDLRLAHAVASIDKHYRRENPDHLTAQIRKVRSGVVGSSAIIHYWSASNPEQNCDALQLAQQCVGEWRKFFVLNGITEPE